MPLPPVLPIIAAYAVLKGWAGLFSPKLPPPPAEREMFPGANQKDKTHGKVELE